MRSFSLAVALFLGGFAGTLFAAPVRSAVDQSKVDQLIQQLGSNNFRQRENATKELDALGEIALKGLKQAATNQDMEIANRAKMLIEKIEQRLASARLLAPTIVELNLKDVTVDEAVAQLSKLSGVPIVISGDKTKMADRKVNLQTGKVSFWTALSLLCEKADLVDADGILVQRQPPVGGGENLPGNPGIRPLPQPLPPERIKPIQIQPLPAPLPPVKENFSEKAPAKAPQKVEAPVQAQAPVQIQVHVGREIQIQPLPAQPVPPVQILPALPPRGGAIARPLPAIPSATIVLVDGKAQYPSYNDHSIRIRAFPTSALKNGNFPAPAVAADEIVMFLQLTPEPKVQIQQILGMKIETASDDLQQQLSAVMALDTVPANDPAIEKLRILQAQGNVIINGPVPVQNNMYSYGPNLYLIRLKKGEKEAKMLTELSGRVTIKMRAPAEDLVTIENILKATGESKKGLGDATLNVTSVTKGDNGDIKIVVELQFSNDIQPLNQQFNPGIIGQPAIGIAQPGNIQIQIAPAPNAPVPQNALPVARPAVANNFMGLYLQDAEGKNIDLVQLQTTKQMWQANGRVMSATMVFRPGKDHGEPAKLVFRGTRYATVDVPFVLKNVPLK